MESYKTPSSFHPEQLTHPKYRADIDGLRALAVWGVILFHAFPKLVTGGFIGVDVFFIISGFLISTIIFSNLENGSFSFWTFYTRRIRRIFPTLLVVLTACLVFGGIVLLGDEFKQLGKHVYGGAGFMSNFVLWNEHGYFDNKSETKPLLHLWSLGIEEQFYIVWPLMLWLAWKRRANLFLVTLLVTSLSFLLNVLTLYKSGVETFYAPYTRFWELLLGAGLAYVALHNVKPVRKLKAGLRRVTGLRTTVLQNAQSGIGLFLLVAGSFLISKDMPFPGFLALIPTTGALLIIGARRDAWVNRVLLSNRIMVWFGLISFPLYLWHWPLLSFARILGDHTPSIIVRCLLISFSVFLAWLTTRFVEKNLRYGKNGNRKALFLVAGMIAIGLAGFAVHKSDGTPSRLPLLSKHSPHRMEQIIKAIDEWDFPGKSTPFLYEGGKYYLKESQSKKYTLYIGDSNAQQYYPRAEELVERNPKTANSVIFAVKGGCFPIPRAHSDLRKFCDGFFERAEAYALSRKDIKTVVIAGNWFSYFYGGKWSYVENGLNEPVSVRSKGYQLALDKMADSIRTLKNDGKRVVLILNIPIGDENNPRNMIRRNPLNFPDVFDLKIRNILYGDLMEKYGAIQEDLAALAQREQIESIDPTKHLCEKSLCPSLDEDLSPIYRDKTHLRSSFARTQASFIDSTIIEQ